MSDLFKDVKVLIVDDEPGIIEMLTECLELEGATVSSAGNGRDGYLAFKKEQPDIVLSDVRMPGGDGIELLQLLRSPALKKQPYVVMMSGFTNVGPETMFNLGCNDYVEKPFKLIEVKNRIAGGYQTFLEK